MNSANSQHDSLTILVKSGLNLALEDELHQAYALLLWDSPINHYANEEHHSLYTSQRAEYITDGDFLNINVILN